MVPAALRVAAAAAQRGHQATVKMGGTIIHLQMKTMVAVAVAAQTEALRRLDQSPLLRMVQQAEQVLAGQVVELAAPLQLMELQERAAVAAAVVHITGPLDTEVLTVHLIHRTDLAAAAALLVVPG